MQGLVSKPEHNGKHGTIMSFNDRTGRYNVWLEVGQTELALKPECVGNLQGVSEPQAREFAGKIFDAFDIDQDGQLGVIETKHFLCWLKGRHFREEKKTTDEEWDAHFKQFCHAGMLPKRCAPRRTLLTTGRICGLSIPRAYSKI